MRRLRPSIRVGLSWAAAHQILAVLGIACAFISEPTFVLAGIFFLLADFSVFVANITLHLAGLVPTPEGAAYLSDGTPLGILRQYRTAIVFVLTWGALQWFFIGLVFEEAAQWRHRKHARKPR